MTGFRGRGSSLPELWKLLLKEPGRVPGQLELHANIWRRQSSSNERTGPTCVQAPAPVPRWFMRGQRKASSGLRRPLETTTIVQASTLAAGCSPWRLKPVVKVREAARGDPAECEEQTEADAPNMSASSSVWDSCWVLLTSYCVCDPSSQFNTNRSSDSSVVICP